jgi:peptide/nickel transport system ATP-binding protein
MADDVAVMYAGRIVERASTLDLFERPTHPYTRGLLRARPQLDSDKTAPLPTIGGMVPALHSLPAGCRFADRCPLVEPACRQHLPELTPLRRRGEDGSAHSAACFVTTREATA